MVQANCVIWVEGPSDRVYLNHWLRAIDADLVEGIHYSVMFYGGRLLSHLTADDPEVTEFISLTAINRHSAVVIDSDKSGPKKAINATKTRVVGELESKGLFSWVTEGREIENYVPIDVLRRAIDAIAPGHGSKALSGRFKKVLPTLGRNRTVDKLKVAHEVASEPPALDPLDLRRRIAELAAFIRRAN